MATKTLTTPLATDKTMTKLIQALDGIGVYPEVVDNLASTATDKPLSANQGHVLDEHVASLASSATSIISSEASRAMASEASLASSIDGLMDEGETVEVKSVGTVPFTANDSAMIHELKGVSRVENQLVQNGNFVDSTGWYITGGTIESVADNVITIKATDSTMYLSAEETFVVGHRYIWGATVKASTSLTGKFGDAYDIFGSFSLTANSWMQMLDSHSCNSASATRARYYFYNCSIGDTVQIKQCFIRDLILYFNGGTIPTLAEIQSKYPELLEPRSYNAGEIVDTTYTSVTSRGRNCFTASTLVQRSGYSNLSAVDTDNGIRITGRGEEGRFAEFVAEVNVGESYTIRYITGTGLRYAFYDTPPTSAMIYGDGTNMYSDVTVTATKRYLALQIELTSDGVYQIEAVLGSTLGNYSPYFTDTLTLPSSVTLRSAGSVADTLDVESGELTRVMGKYTITGNESFTDTGGNQKIINGWAQDQGAKIPSSNSVKANIQCAFAINETYDNANVSGKTGLVAVSYTGFFLVTLDIYNNWSNLVGKEILYELATLTTESVTPTPAPYIFVEPGGTITPSQAQSIKIDTDMTVSYPSEMKSEIGLTGAAIEAQVISNASAISSNTSAISSNTSAISAMKMPKISDGSITAVQTAILNAFPSFPTTTVYGEVDINGPSGWYMGRKYNANDGIFTVYIWGDVGYKLLRISGGTIASFDSPVFSSILKGISSAPTENYGYMFTTGSSTVAVGNITLAAWTMGIFITNSNDGVIIAYGLSGKLYVAFRNNGNWGSGREI